MPRYQQSFVSVRLMLVGLMLGMILLLSGCTTSISQSNSYVTSVSQDDAGFLAPIMSTYIAGLLPPASTTLTVMSTPSEAGADALTPLLMSDLKARGFALALPTQQVVGAHSLRYLVSPLNNGQINGVLVRIYIDNQVASRFFTRDVSGTLINDGTLFTVGRL